jgi:MerR family transcriptional regulator, redox-sensitive transcriptional activator SoxR
MGFKPCSGSNAENAERVRAKTRPAANRPDRPRPAQHLEHVMPSQPDEWIEIGPLARRSGVAASALRYYEDQGLLAGGRSASGRRRYPRAVLRRVAFIRVAQSLGLSLAEIRAALATLPGERTPTPADWQRLSRSWQPVLDARIAALTRLRDQLSACIGCGCLSMQRCALYNPGDVAGALGEGPRYLLGDAPPRPGTDVPVRGRRTR